MVDLSIVIVSWNTREILRKCLQSVYSTVSGLSYEVIVVDNSSSDGSVEMVRDEFSQVKVIANTENAGFARANNQGIELSEGRYILLLNSDAFLVGQAASQLYSFMESNERAGITGAHLSYPDGRPQNSHNPLPTLLSEVISLAGLDKLHRPGREAEKGLTHVRTGQVKGACLMVRRKTLDEIGLLDEGFFMFGEETDLCFRAIKRGWEVYHLPSAKVVHIEGGSTGNSSHRIVLLYKGKLRYFEKNHGRLARQLLWFFMCLTGLGKILVYGSLERLKTEKTYKDRYWQAVMREFALR